MFAETRGAPSEPLLAEYSAAVYAPESTGAALLSVMGGRLSEGINFSDRLGRGVIVVGLPYPNPQSAEWLAKSAYVEATTQSQLTTPGTALYDEQLTEAEARVRAKKAAQDYYENACLRAVNQSVGRAIRHKDDYAAIILVDRRYGNEGTRGKLSGWVKENFKEECTSKGVGEMMGGLSAFFRGRSR